MNLKPLAALCLLLLLSSCRAGGSGSLSTQNDQLRKDNLDLKARVHALEGERDELRAKVTEAQGAHAQPADILDALPRITGLDLGTFSGFTPSDRSTPATGIVAYVIPHDSRDRFTQAVGTLTVEALLMPEVGKGDPMRIASITLTPGPLRDAYRSGITGTHYEINMPLATPIARSMAAQPTIMIRAKLIDGITGKTHEVEKTVKR